MNGSGNDKLIAPCPRQEKPKPTHWIEIELLGEDGKPIPNEPYGIRLTDGSIYEGNLNENGLARHDGIDAGVCLVWFRQLAATAWEEIPTASATGQPRAGTPTRDSTFEASLKETGWISIQLLGEDGAPIDGERYEIELPDGKVESGVLDEQGEALLTGIPKGRCQVTFPDLERHSWELFTQPEATGA